MKRKSLLSLVSAGLCLILFTGCSPSSAVSTSSSSIHPSASTATKPSVTLEPSASPEATQSPEVTASPEISPSPDPSVSPQVTEVPVEQNVETTPAPLPQPGSKKLIVLDPGHTSQISSETEPLGPGSTEMKAKDAIGTTGVATGLHEYDLTMQVCQKLRNELQARGYTVLLTHETNDVMISCAERAAVANENNADLFLRVHADGSESSSAAGAMTICTTPYSPFHPELYQRSRLLSDDLINTYCNITGRTNRGVWETDSMTGNNWSAVPVTLIEMGFMTNPDEDVWMASEDGQYLIVQGIANGIDQYFADLN